LLASQVGEILIVDNGSSEEALNAIRTAARAVGATVLEFRDNMGIATALNAGLNFARDRGYPWLATLDQDSRVTDSMIAGMSQALASYPDPDRVAVITPVHVDNRAGVRIKDGGCEDAGCGWRVLASTMTSGNLVNVQAASVAGAFDESLFIDYVDHEFCLRLRRRGYRVLEASAARLIHSLGKMESRRFGAKRVLITNHSALRRYYISRNRVIVWGRFWTSEGRWVLRDMRRFLIESAFIVLYEKQAMTKLWMTIRGVIDAIRNVRGAFKPATDRSRKLIS
jgi:rhamnosyltransferase